MRIISEFETQFKLGQSSLSEIKLDYTSRDDITKLLLGLQSISLNKQAKKKIFQILEKTITVKSIGRSGMSLWRILVLGLLRQVISADYDRVCNLANNHAELRQFLGHGMIDLNDRYSLESIKDNVSLLSDDALNEINTVMVQLGHGMLDSRITKQLNIKTDSFVVKSNVHYPTDTSLLFDEFKAHANRQIDQINRRIILKEIIPHSEKVFSLFNPFTEWVSKGKAGVPVELGLKVSISTDQHSFILAHRIMEQEQDVDAAIPIITKVKESFPNIYSASFDRGYYSPANQRELSSIVSKLILPKKGKVSKKDRDKFNEIMNIENYVRSILR